MQGFASLVRSTVWRRRPLPFSFQVQAPPPFPAQRLCAVRELATIPLRWSKPNPDANIEGLQHRLDTHGLAQKEEASDARRVNAFAAALRILRREGSHRDTGKEAHRRALLTLGHYGRELAPADALRVVHQALAMRGLQKLAFITFLELSKRPEGLAAIVQDVNALLLSSCRAEQHRMAIMLVSMLQQAHTKPVPAAALEDGFSPTAPPVPTLSREASLALLRLLQERSRSQHYWHVAEDMVKDQRVMGASVDVEVVAAAMVVAWRAVKWAAVQRLSAYVAGKAGVPEVVLLTSGEVRKEEGKEEESRGELRRVLSPGLSEYARKNWKTAMTLRSLVKVLGRMDAKNEEDVPPPTAAETAGEGTGRRSGRDAGGQGHVPSAGAPHVLHTAHMNMYLKALLRVRQLDEAHAVLSSMLSPRSPPSPAPSSLPPSLPLPPPDVLSLCMLMEALGRQGDAPAVLTLLNRAQDLPWTPTPSDYRVLYKTAIAAVGKQGRWEGALSLYYEMHERGVAADAQVFTSLLKALKTGGKADSAFSFLEAMKAQNITPTRTVYNVLFSLLGEMGQFEEAVQLFEKMKKELGKQGSPYDYGTLISACGKTAVLRLREERPRAAAKGWDGLEASVPREHGEEAVDLLVRRAESMLQEILDQIRLPAAFSSRSVDGGAPPRELDPKASFPASAYPVETQDGASVIGSSASSPPYPFDRAGNHGCATGRSLGIHSSSSRRRRTHDGGLGNVFTQLLKVYGKTGRWQEARNLLERMRGEGWMEPTPGHYYEAMRACAFALRPDDALGLLREARGQRGQEPGNSSKPPLILCWNAAILACQRAGRWMSCLELLKTMEGTGLCPGPSNYARAIQACGEAGKVEEAWKVYEEVGQAAGGGKGSREPVVYGSMLRLCGLHRDAPGVRRVWTDLLEAPGLGADPLNVVQAVAAWAWEIGDLDAGRAVLLGPGGKERDEATRSPASVDSAPVAPPPLHFPPPLLGFHALMLATLRHGGSAEEAQVACQELVDVMMERFSVCPTSTTKAILVRAGCDVSDLFVEEDETQDWEEAEARVQGLVAMNPYDPRRRKRVSEGESG